MICTTLQGGLGNQMFQIAFIKSFGRRHGLRSGLNGIDANLRHLTHAYNRSPHAYEYLRIFKNLDWWENFDDLYEVNRNKDRKSTRLNSSHLKLSRMPSSA